MIGVGETFVNGKNAETARALLSAAERVGLDPALVVRTTQSGFIVPDEVADAAAFDDDESF